METEKVMSHSKVGIMADSHGQPHTIIDALNFLTKKKCHPIFHLGDICDSFHPETAEACLRPLLEHSVKALKGNNDHAIVVNNLGQNQRLVSETTLSHFKNLPLSEKHLNAYFVHSLPFVDELGLACMIGDMGPKEAVRFFNSSPASILFRGHGHTPGIVFSQKREIVSKEISPGQDVDVQGMIPCIITCGALTRGLCIIWQPGENRIECHSFR